MPKCENCNDEVATGIIVAVHVYTFGTPAKKRVGKNVKAMGLCWTCWRRTGGPYGTRPKLRTAVERILARLRPEMAPYPTQELSSPPACVNKQDKALGVEP